ncbi:MAG: SPASM domain-containing protein [Tannerellaceae bacterium]|nr:SPASM domain-containing protein [Tannerellaceae bacterium]
MKKWVVHIRSFFRFLRRLFINGLVLRGYHKKIPTTIIIEPTNRCNLTCICCPHGNAAKTGRPSGCMDPSLFDSIIGNIDTPVKEICLYLHGEPFLNKNLDYFVGQISQRAIMTTIYSNGYDIDLELLDKVLAYRKTRFSFSVDIISKTSYESIRQPASYEKMIHCLRQINSVFKSHRRTYELSMITGDKDWEVVRGICDGLFAQYDCLKKISFGSKFPWPEYFYTGELAERLSKKRNLCNQISNSVAVYWNGDVTHCSYDYSGKLIIGNLSVDKLSEIYNSTEARKIRACHYLQRYSKLPICKQCVLPRYKSSTFSVGRRKTKDKVYEKDS